MSSRIISAWGLFFLAMPSCGSPDKSQTGVDGPKPTISELQDPEYCKKCHAGHYSDWSTSMHAYAADDPVFLAMNRRGQEETQNKLGDFCVKCHAPMAVATGLTENGLNLPQLDKKYRGVTCYFCHNAIAVEGTHNNPIKLASDNIMRGGFGRAVRNYAHESEYSPFMAGTESKSSDFCGSCHDIVLDSPVMPHPTRGEPIKLERTFSEWKDSRYPASRNGCNTCHMRSPEGSAEAPAADFPNVKNRVLHSHLFPAIDTAFEQFPNTNNAEEDKFRWQDYRRKVQGFLDYSVRLVQLCVISPESASDRFRIHVELDNLAGHAWPSGASHDRRAWLEVRAFLDDKEVYSSGYLTDDQQDITKLADPDLHLFNDKALKANGEEAHMFWDVADVVTGTIPPAIVSNPNGSHGVRTFPVGSSNWIRQPYDIRRLRVTLRLRIQPMGFDVLDDLVQSKHLSPETRARMPILTVHPYNSWSEAQRADEPRLNRLDDLTFEWSEFTLTKFPAYKFDVTINARRDDGTRWTCIGK